MKDKLNQYHHHSKQINMNSLREENNKTITRKKHTSRLWPLCVSTEELPLYIFDRGMTFPIEVAVAPLSEPLDRATASVFTPVVAQLGAFVHARRHSSSTLQLTITRDISLLENPTLRTFWKRGSYTKIMFNPSDILIDGIVCRNYVAMGNI